MFQKNTIYPDNSCRRRQSIRVSLLALFFCLLLNPAYSFFDSSNPRGTKVTGILKDSKTTPPNRPPRIANFPRPKLILENQKLQLLISATDPDGDRITLSASALPSGASFDPRKRLFSWKPSYGQAGTYRVTFSATDGKLTTSTTLTIIVKAVDRTPFIGPEGGVVTSSDGKVELTIPPGALSAPQQIRLNSINKQPIARLAPQGKTLLSVVECLPKGLNFSLPVSLTYTLSEAQIPGTPVSLGLYENNKIYLTSEPSVIPALDSYKVTFNIRHFSTYTALAGFISQGAPIGSGVKIPLPDLLTGSFSSSIPITLPPGRKGMQPQLALNYRSSNSNSWVGLGFSLNPGYIVRSTRLGPPTYDDKKDTFYLITDSGTTELVNLVDNLYQAKVESSFTKFFKEADDSWRALSKDGAVLRFGQGSEAKETSDSGTFSWFLTRAIDTNGNYISYSYTKDQGKAYLKRIDYTGNENGTLPANSVEFSTEARNDVSSSYISSSRIATSLRLKEIQVKAGDDLVWRYELAYAYSPDTNRSILKSITQYTSDEKNLPVQTFSYQQAK